MRGSLGFPCAVGLLISLAGNLQAQNTSQLVGTWQRFSLKDSTGAVSQPPQAPAFTVFTADGYYVQVAIPAGRPKVTKPFVEHTREELVARYRYGEARYGRYTTSGNTLTRTYVGSLDPSLEGGQQVQNFRVEGDVLILTSTNAASKSEARFRRAK